MRGAAQLFAVAVAVAASAPTTEARRGGGDGGVVGTVFIDAAQRDGVYVETDDLELIGYRVDLVRADEPGVAVDSTISNADGRFAFTAVEPGRYRLRALSPSGVELAETSDFDIADAQAAERDVRVDPTGRVYDAVTGAPVAGVRLIVYFDGDDGAVVPVDELGPGQQGQVTSADGIYRLDLLPGRRYRIAVDTSQIAYAAPSTLIPPRAGFAPAGAVVAQPLPDLSGDTAYYLRLDVADSQYAVLNNHLPVDPLAERVELRKRADRPSAAAGDLVAYTITATNRSARDLREVYLRDVPARGLTYLAGQVRATLGDRAIAALDRTESPRSRRLVRFGPFELPAGETLTVTYHVSVGVDTREGDYLNRATLIDGAGVELSNTAEATVRVANDPIFDEAMVVGRVFCDDDDDGALDDGEPGLLGARVFVDTGSYAVTDAAGLFHLTQLEPGTHLIKLDTASLAGGAPTTEASRVLYLTRGLPARVSFGAKCPREQVDTTHRYATLRRATDARPDATATAATAATPAAGAVRGSVADMTVTVDGEPLTLPVARVDRAGDGFALAYSGAGVAADEWVLAINRHEADGALAQPMVRTWKGAGAPPASVAWDGLDDAGAPLPVGLYSAQLAVRGAARGAMAVSRRVPFAVQPEAAASGPDREAWRGELFGGTTREPTATAQLRARVAAVAERLGPDDTLQIEVHADGTGTRIQTAAETQRQAGVIVELFAAAGVAAERVEARGRGSLDPLEPPTSAEGRERNRRVTIEIGRARPAAAPVVVPAEILDAPAATVGGQPAALDAEGRFETTAAPPVCVELVARDGRLGARCAAAPAATPSAALPSPSPPGPRRVALVGDLATGTFAIDGVPVRHELLAVDSALVDSAGGTLVLAATVPAELEPASWSIEIRDAAGAVVHSADGAGTPPERVAWNGGDTLQPGTTYSHALTIELADGSRATSAPRRFTYEPPPATEDIPELAHSGAFFRGRSRLSTALKNHLSLIASALATTERYAISLRIATTRLPSVAEQRLVMAARRAAVARYLGDMGVADARYDLTVEASTGRADEIRVAALRAAEPPAPVEAVPAFAINGVEQPLADVSIDTSLELAAGEPLVVDLTLPSSQRLRFVAALPAQQPSGATPPAPTPAATDAALRSSRAAALSAVLPSVGARLRSPRVPVRGTTDPRNRVTVAGKPVHVRADGSFHAIAALSPGEQTLSIVARDDAGNEAEIAWPVAIDATDTFLLVLAEGVAATAYDPDRGWSADDAWLDGMTEESSIAIGPVRLHGRAVAYLKARLQSYEVTAHIDTAKQPGHQPFFEQLVDPARDLATYGDSADEVRDANARGKVYVHIADGHGKSATVGNIRGRLRGGDLLRFDRTFYGAAIELDGLKLSDRHQVDVTAFSAFEDTGLSRDINLFRATGGSLYYLRHGHVVEGSEQIRVAIRDRDTGLLIGERVAVRNVDYTVDYPAGRVLFTEPPASVADAGWLLDNLGAGGTPLDGHPVFVEIQYEHEDGGAGGSPTGAYVRDTIGDRLAIGAGVIGEGRDGGDYTLWGVDASYRIDDRSRVRAELGASRNADGANYASGDGGLSFDRLGSATTETSYGWKISADLGLGDATTAALHAQSLELGFSAGATVLEQGRTKLGGVVAHKLDATDTIAVRHEADLAELDDRTSLRSAAQWRRALSAWTFTVEGGHEYVDDSLGASINRVGVAGRAAHALTDRVTVRVGQEIQTALSDDDPLLADELGAGVTTSAGGDLELAPGLRLSADELLRWNGDNATRVGLTTRLGAGGSMYVREQFGTRGDDFVATTIVGAADHFGANGGGRTYGEYQLESGGGQRNRAVLGLGHRWQVARGVRLGTGYEHQHLLGGVDRDGQPIGTWLRDIVHGEVGLTRFDRLQAGGRLELRWDDTDAAERVQVVAGVGADVKLTPDMTLLGRLRTLHTTDLTNRRLTVQPEAVPSEFTAAERTELIAGWAYRPPRADWLDVFAQYAYQLEQRPAAQADAAPEARSHVASIAPVASLPLRLSLSSKLAWKRTQLASPSGAAETLTADTDALLWLLRLGYRVYGKWELAAEYRQLQLWRTDDAAEQRHGALFEATYNLLRRVRLGVGYNLSRFSDNELRDLEHDSHGLFMRVVGYY